MKKNIKRIVNNTNRTTSDDDIVVLLRAERRTDARIDFDVRESGSKPFGRGFGVVFCPGDDGRRVAEGRRERLREGVGDRCLRGWRGRGLGILIRARGNEKCIFLCVREGEREGTSMAEGQGEGERREFFLRKARESGSVAFARRLHKAWRSSSIVFNSLVPVSRFVPRCRALFRSFTDCDGRT